MKVVCIIQARTGSTRLPKKVLKNIQNKTVLEHIVRRVQLAKNMQKIVIATTINTEDNLIVEEAKKLGVDYYRGDEEDVLSRYYHAAKKYSADVVVRITSDCPCIDYEILENMVEYYKERERTIKLDYLNNTLERTYPRGYDIEIFSFECLEKAFLNAGKNYEREHVTPYMYDTNNDFIIDVYKGENDYSKYRLTLDTSEDFEVIEKLYEKLYKIKPEFLLEDVINAIKENPEIMLINEKILQKEINN